MINKLTDSELTDYGSMANGSTVNESIPNQSITIEYTPNESTGNEPTVPENCLPNIDDNSSHCSVEFFQFAGDHIIVLICLPLNATHLLQSLDIEIFKLLVNAYYSELDRRH